LGWVGGGQVGSRRPAMDGTTGNEQRTLVKFDQSNHTPTIIMLLENFGKKKRVVDSSRSAEELCGSTNGAIRGHLVAAPCLKSGIFLDEFFFIHLMNLDFSQKNLCLCRKEWVLLLCTGLRENPFGVVNT
jgi:hypothetical protein